MKTLIFLFLLLTSSAYALDICSFEETWEFREALEQHGIVPYKKSSTFGRYNFMEKDMIHLTVSLQDWLSGISMEDALENFYEGEILYYKINGKEYALVHYWPGDNEFGGFFEVKKRSYRLIAEINDSFIGCR